jgi:hypothetical protein
MLPPRVHKYDDKFFIIIDNEVKQIKTKLKEIEDIQKKISTHLHVYERGYPIPNKKIKQIGKGDVKLGLSNFDIEKIMRKFGAYKYGFQGVIPNDYIDRIKPTLTPFSFMINTDNSHQKGRHWIAIYIDPKNEKEIDIFDSFGDDPSVDRPFQDALLSGLKTLIDKLHLPYMLKMKMNLIPQQPDYDKDGNLSDTCGYHAMKFILDRIRGETFKEASGINDINDIVDLKESEINKFKKRIDKLKYI